jgi:hypothetical protein
MILLFPIWEKPAMDRMNSWLTIVLTSAWEKARRNIKASDFYDN